MNATPALIKSTSLANPIGLRACVVRWRGTAGLLAIAAVVLAPAVCLGQSYTISTFAGGGSLSGTAGDGGAATSAALGVAAGVAVDAAGNLYIADAGLSVIRRVTPLGIISTVAGISGFSGESGDGAAATKARLNLPAGVVLDAYGNMYIADQGNDLVRKVDTNGNISRLAGGGGNSSLPAYGDGFQANQAILASPQGVALDAAGNLYIADYGHHLVRKVAALDQTITTYAGNGNASPAGGGTSGDGGQATAAPLVPAAIAVDANGNLYIADDVNHRIRLVNPKGIISTVAGNGSGLASGDNGPASAAGMNAPEGVAVDSVGNVFFADKLDHRVRMVSSGTITSIAGNGTLGSSGDGGAATSAQLNSPTGVAVDSYGRVYIADGANGYHSSVRMLTPTGPAVPSIKSGGVVSAGAFGGFSTVAPGSWIEIYGANLAVDSRQWAGSDFTGVNAPTALDGTFVTIGGQRAFVDYISPGQVNAQVPSNVATGAQPVIVNTAAGASSPASIAVAQQEPGLLAPASFIVGGKQYLVGLFSDGATYVLPPGAIAGVPSRRAQPGDIITLYGVGFGAVTPNIPAGQVVQQANTLNAPFHVFFGATEAAVQYDGLAPSAVGLYQFNVVVPNVASSDTLPVTFTLGGVAGTQTLYTAVQNGSLTAGVQSLALSTNSIAGGSLVQATVTLTAPAAAGGAVVGLSSSSTAASVPATVLVPAGSTAATFTVTTSAVRANQTVTVTATLSGISAQATLTVTAPAGLSFSRLNLSTTFAAAGYASGGFILTVQPENGLSTFTANGGVITWTGCTLSNLTLTCNSLAPGSQAFVAIAAANLQPVSSASLIVSFQPGAASPPWNGGLTGTLSVSGTISGTSNPVTLSGPLTGNYTLID